MPRQRMPGLDWATWARTDLNPTAKAVLAFWNACEVQPTQPEIAAGVGISQRAVWDALKALRNSQILRDHTRKYCDNHLANSARSADGESRKFCESSAPLSVTTKERVTPRKVTKDKDLARSSSRNPTDYSKTHSLPESELFAVPNTGTLRAPQTVPENSPRKSPLNDAAAALKKAFETAHLEATGHPYVPLDGDWTHLKRMGKALGVERGSAAIEAYFARKFFDDDSGKTIRSLSRHLNGLLSGSAHRGAPMQHTPDEENEWIINGVSHKWEK